MMEVKFSKDVIQKTLEILEERAQKEQLINYGELYPKIGLNTEDPADRNRGAVILGEVNKITINKKNVMISALVVLSEKHYPAPGFFEFSIEQDRMPSSNNEFQRLAFWVEEVKRIFNVYGERK